MHVIMDSARQHWPILRRLGTDLANRVRSFMVIGERGEGLLVATDDGQGFWLGTMKFSSGKSRTVTEPSPLDVPDLVSMAHGENFILLLNKRGEIYSMGENALGQLGLGTEDKETHFTPQLISIPHKFTSIRCGRFHSLALTEDGKVWAWGWNCYWQVGVLSLTFCLPSPHQISGLNSHRVVAVEVGGAHSLALTDQGEVYAWGENNWDQLCYESEELVNLPTRIPTPSPIKSMAASFNHTLLLTRTGEMFACGGNLSGQLGQSDYNEYIETIPHLVKIAGLPLISEIASHPLTELSIAMSTDQRCFVWGKLTDEKLEENLQEKLYITISTPRELPPCYSTLESPLSFYSLYRSTPHSVTILESPPNRVITRMSRMFDNPETSDVQFVVEQKTIHAHRNILSNFSDYFALMFSERWLSPVDPDDPIVKVTIPDHSYQAFHAFLRFLYTDCLEVHPNLLPELFELASHYLESDLQQVCLSRMRTTLTPTTCCLYYSLTHRHSLPELTTFQQELVQFVSSRMSEVVNSAAFQSMEPDLRGNLTNAVQNLIGHFQS